MALQCLGLSVGRVRQGDAVNASVTGGYRVNIDLHDLAAGVELGQQIVVVAVGCFVAKLEGEPDRDEDGVATL